MKITGQKPGINTDSYVKKVDTKGHGKQAGSREVYEKDMVDISQRARELNRIKRMLETVPEVRWEMVERIKGDIEHGNYRVNPNKVAEKMLERAIRNALHPKK